MYRTGKWTHVWINLGGIAHFGCLIDNPCEFCFALECKVLECNAEKPQLRLEEQMLQRPLEDPILSQKSLESLWMKTWVLFSWIFYFQVLSMTLRHQHYIVIIMTKRWIWHRYGSQNTISAILPKLVGVVLWSYNCWGSQAWSQAVLVTGPVVAASKALNRKHKLSGPWT